MHKLTEELYNTHSDGSYITLHIDNADKIITAYLRERADWLMNSCLHKNGRSSVELIEQAFELSEKCEKDILGDSVYACCQTARLKGIDCPAHPKPSIPSKLSVVLKEYRYPAICQHMVEDLVTSMKKLEDAHNQLLDFLHSKEAR